MPFTTDLVVREAKGKDHWQLVADLEYSGRWDAFVVPAGFSTDFASVPRVFWATHPPYGRHTKAAVVHDFLYRKRPRSRKGGRITRKDADGIFERIMRELGTSWWRRKTMYLAVRAFGWLGFAK